VALGAFCNFFYQIPSAFGFDCVRRGRLVSGDAVGRGQECLDAFRSFFAMGKIRGTPCMRRHIPARRATTKYFSTPLFSKLRLKRKDFQEIVRLTWAQEAPGSNPGAPTINLLN
jgi:hypothetical protein